MGALLVIMFFQHADPDVLFMRFGWEPREQPTMEVCLERKQRVEEYLAEFGDEDVGVIVTCLEN